VADAATRVPSPSSEAAPEAPQVAHAEHGVHLASYNNRENAVRGWDQLAHRNSDLLHGLEPDIRKVQVDGKGVYYRLYAVPVDSAQAAALCSKLRARGVYCQPQG
jgi:hypothetical protein